MILSLICSKLILSNKKIKIKKKMSLFRRKVFQQLIIK